MLITRLNNGIVAGNPAMPDKTRLVVWENVRCLQVVV